MSNYFRGKNSNWGESKRSSIRRIDAERQREVGTMTNINSKITQAQETLDERRANLGEIAATKGRRSPEFRKALTEVTKARKVVESLYGLLGAPSLLEAIRRRIAVRDAAFAAQAEAQPLAA